MSNKYAIVEANGRQYNVKVGDVIKTELFKGEAGASFTFDKVLLVREGESTKIGVPYVADAKVLATLEAHGRHKKVLVFKYLRKSKSKKLQGHRQSYSALKITGIEG